MLLKKIRYVTHIPIYLVAEGIIRGELHIPLIELNTPYYYSKYVIQIYYYVYTHFIHPIRREMCDSLHAQDGVDK